MLQMLLHYAGLTDFEPSQVSLPSFIYKDELPKEKKSSNLLCSTGLYYFVPPTPRKDFIIKSSSVTVNELPKEENNNNNNIKNKQTTADTYIHDCQWITKLWTW